MQHLERPPLPPAEPESSENKESPKPNWAEYIFQMDQHVTNNEPVELEEQLLQKHPTLPSELEAFNWLQEHKDDLGHEPKVKLDDSGLHVISSDHTAA